MARTDSGRTVKRKTSARKGRQRQPDNVRERIGQAALSLFEAKGYDGVSIRDIAQEGGTTNALIYHYFGNKEGLFREILLELRRKLGDAVTEAAGQEGTAMERLSRFCDAYLTHYEKEPGARFMMRELLRLGSDVYAEVASELDATLRHTLRDLLKAGVDEGIFRNDALDMCAIGILGILTTFVRRRAVGASRLSLDSAKAQVMDFYINGLRAK